MKPQIALAFVMAATPALAQQTGVSRPPDTLVEDVPAVSSPAEQPLPAAAKPSAAIPVTSQTSQEQYGEYKPYNTPGSSSIVLRSHANDVDPDAGIVTEVPRKENELPIGTSMHMRLHEAVSTETTQPNTPFTADLMEDVVSDGRVILPTGSMIEGTVTEVRGGRRIRGSAMVHLQPQYVVLPDGARMRIRAAVIDTDQFADTRVDNEGNIVRKDHVGATLAAMSLTTGGAAAAGAVIGGGVGALVGAGIGAGVSTAWWLKQDRQTHLPKDTVVVVSLTAPLEFQKTNTSDFSMVPMKSPGATAMIAPAPSSAPYVAPQAFVPTN
jgi:hypothetical protein